MPAGQGKSLCYQLPALLLEGVVVVVSPLLEATASDTSGHPIHGTYLDRVTFADAIPVVSDIDRPNVFYRLVDKEALSDPVDWLIKYANSYDKNTSGLIYVRIKREADALTLEMQTRCFRVAAYHTDLQQQTRTRVLEDWLSNRIRVVIATVAFGMGINHPRVRFVVHWDVPMSLEALYQESGQTGRGGLPSGSLLMHSHKEFNRRWCHAVQSERALSLLRAVHQYAATPTYRRHDLLRYFNCGHYPVQFNDRCCDRCVAMRGSNRMRSGFVSKRRKHILA